MRYRTQLGTLSVIGKDDAATWTGRFWVYAPSANGKGKPKGRKKTVRLGLCTGMNRTEAQAKLVEIIQETGIRNARLTVFAQPSDRDIHTTLPYHQRGAVGELLVATDLMRRGLEVFRNLNPTGTTDLLVMDKGSIPMRVEVKFMTAGSHSPRRYLYGKRNFDVLAVVSDSGHIRYLDGDGNALWEEVKSLNVLGNLGQRSSNDEEENVAVSI